MNGICVMIFSTAIMCVAAAFAMIYGMEFAEITSTKTYSDAKNIVNKIILKICFSIFGFVSGFILFLYGLTIALF